MSANAQKPVTLQLRPAAGKWRSVCHFDAADVAATDSLMEAGESIARHATDKPAVRIVIAGTGDLLAHFDSPHGWVLDGQS